ncbi:MAG TPA: 4-hydroxythreonine-4-phosphate dehydrogenase PdxA [Dehalococcoidia bacterium]|nr:4-hydroxythreonine-4-phosphate dehydrogenase PdxA [Dehalococcoidia bacterium]
MASQGKRPIIAITIGDPAGIGPEVTAGALAHGRLDEVCRPLLLGDAGVLRQAARCMGVELKLVPVASPADATFAPDEVSMLDLANVDLGVLRMGEIQGACGQAAYGYIRKSIELALAGEVDAVATAPINKEALRAGGVPYLDHTAMYADLTHSLNPMTMFTVGTLRIFFATRHVSLRTAVDQIAQDLVLENLVNADEALKSYGLTAPRIALAALNPHNGEGGLFGDTESRELRPAVEAARARGINASGPYPADSVFHMAMQGGADAVLSLFHDQGHIAAKSIDFEKTIAITTGLPFVRASVDHGTAFDIAGTGKASWVSMAEAVRVGAEYARLFRETREGQAAQT